MLDCIVRVLVCYEGATIDDDFAVQPLGHVVPLVADR